MPLPGLDYQLQLDLDLPEETTGQDGRVLTAEEIRLRSETARQLFEKRKGSREQPDWFNEYEELRNGGWPWRVAAYIAWASSPRVGRKPKTQDEMAREFLGLTSDRAVATWRKRNPAINEMVTVMQSAPLWEHRREIFSALLAVAVQPDYKSHNDRKLALEILGDYIPAAKLAAILTRRGVGENLSEYSEEELAVLSGEVEKLIKERADGD